MSMNRSCLTGFGLSFFGKRLMPRVLPFLRIFKSEFLIQDLLSRLIVNEDRISMFQSLSLGVENQKQIKFPKLKTLLLFNDSFNDISRAISIQN